MQLLEVEEVAGSGSDNPDALAVLEAGLIACQRTLWKTLEEDSYDVVIVVAS